MQQKGKKSCNKGQGNKKIGSRWCIPKKGEGGRAAGQGDRWFWTLKKNPVHHTCALKLLCLWSTVPVVQWKLWSLKSMCVRMLHVIYDAYSTGVAMRMMRLEVELVSSTACFKRILSNTSLPSVKNGVVHQNWSPRFIVNTNLYVLAVIVIDTDKTNWIEISSWLWAPLTNYFKFNHCIIHHIRSIQNIQIKKIYSALTYYYSFQRVRKGNSSRC